MATKKSEVEKVLVGKNWLFRAVTYHAIGTVEKIVDGKWAVLKNACWVAESARFTQTLQNGELNEVEITGKHYVNLDTVVDFFPWLHALPKEQK